MYFSWLSVLRWTFTILAMAWVAGAIGAIVVLVIAIAWHAPFVIYAFVVYSRDVAVPSIDEILWPAWGFTSPVAFLLILVFFWPRKVSAEELVVHSKAPQPPSP